MHVDEIRKEIFPMQEFYSTSLNLTQPIFPKDLEKISFNRHAYWEEVVENVPIKAYLLREDVWRFEINEYWACEINFQKGSLFITEYSGFFLENDSLQDCIQVDTVFKDFEELTPKVLIEYLYYFYFKVHLQMIKKVVEIELYYKYNWQAEYLEDVAEASEYESSSLPHIDDDDLPF
jgi:hypothetical protein